MSTEVPPPSAQDGPIIVAEFPGPLGEPRVGMAVQLGQSRTIIASGEWGALGAMWIVPASSAPVVKPLTDENVGPGPAVFLMFSSQQAIDSMRESLAVVEKHVQRCAMKIYSASRDGEVLYLAARDIGHARAIFVYGPGEIADSAADNPIELSTDGRTVCFEELTPRQAGEIKLAGKMTLWNAYLALDGRARPIVRIGRDRQIEFFPRGGDEPGSATE